MLQIDKPRTHVIAGFKKIDETDYEPKFRIVSGGIGSLEIKINITSGGHPTVNTTFYSSNKS